MKTARELKPWWDIRDHRYAMLKHDITPDMAASVRANRLWEIEQLESKADRATMLAILSAWHPRFEVTG